MKHILLAALAALSLHAHAIGTADLGRVGVLPLGSGAPVHSVRLGFHVSEAGEQLHLAARTSIDTRLLALPAQEAGNLLAALEKAQRWLDLAAEKNAELQKPLACLGSDPTGACTEAGVAIQADQLGLLFVATAGGQQNALLVTFRDGPGALQRSAFYLQRAQLDELVAALAPWQQSLASARSQADTAALFK